MENLVANLSGRFRRATLNGRPHLVVPVSMIVPGVLNGSRGPLLYPIEEISKNPDAWNGVPLVVYHPFKNGQAIKASDPEVLQNQGVGVVQQSQVNGKLKAEAWFDIENTQTIDDKLPEQVRILPRLERNQPIELSTGLDLDVDPVPEGTKHKDGREYVGVARNYRPDHLAILPDQRGACSLLDGCGVLVNANSVLIGRSGEEDGHTHSIHVDENGNGWTGHEDGHVHKIKDFKILRVDPDIQGSDAHTHSLDKEALVDSGIKNVAALNELTHDQIRDELNSALRKRFNQDEMPVHVNEVFDDFFVFSQGEQLFRLNYIKTKNKVGLSRESPQRVIRNITFTTVNATKTVGGKQLPASAFAYVPDSSQPSTWKLRIDDKTHVAGAVAALGKGFRGQKVSIPRADLPAVKRKVRAAWLKFNPDKSREDLPPVIANAKQEDNSMADKEKLIDFLVDNCDCWEADDKDVLNEFSDERIQSLVENVKQTQNNKKKLAEYEQQATENRGGGGGGKGGGGGGGKSMRDMTDEELENELKNRRAKNKGSTKNEEGDVVQEIISNTKKASFDDLLANADDSAKQQWDYVKSTFDQAKKELVQRIVANVNVDEEKLRAYTQQLLGKNMDELNMIANLVPKRQSAQGSQPSYFGANAPAHNVGRDDDDFAKDCLPLPTINWQEEAERQRRA